MYVYYLRNLYLDNRLIEPGALTMAGERDRPRRRSTMPAYVYASRDDHIVPWRSAYRTTALLGGDVTFVLGASGHIAGVINPPAKSAAQLLDQRAHHRRCRRLARARATAVPGSWWPHWAAWLAAHGGAHAARRRAKRGNATLSAARAGARALRAREAGDPRRPPPQRTLRDAA